MRVFSIQRDYGPNVSIVRIVTDATPEEVNATGWLVVPEIANSIIAVNNGAFEWNVSDIVLIRFVDPVTGDFLAGANFYAIFPDFQSLNPLSVTFPNLQNIVAHAGGGQTNATQLNLGINVITTVATAGDSVKLPTDVLGQTVVVYNTGANAANIFPSLGDTINGMAANAPISLPSGSLMAFYGVSTSAWVSEASIQPVYRTTTGLTALAGGGQTGATPLNYGTDVITVCATAGDSVILPSGVLGQTVIVINRGANACNVFPATGQKINAGSANVPFSLAVNDLTAFYGMLSDTWFTLQSA
jgi:hypothetical protein